MTSKSEKDRAKQIQDRCQNILLQMLKDEDNKYCVDCDAKGPRWASWNLGIFLCIRCAGIHRNLGVHISKVKSVNLDSWTPEQVVSLQQMGNSRARAVYEANLPDSFRRPQNDSSLEAFIRAKYEHKKYIAKEWVQPPPPKVNWDKEIDEELEKQKRKKKTTSSGLGPLPAPSSSDKKYNKSDVIPSIPKPKSSVSPKLGRSTPTAQTHAKSNGSADLLGLDTSAKPETKNEDIFSSFFSAPEPQVKPEEPKQDLKTEEENFFKQPTPSEKEKSKLTKDSILALYSQTPSNNLANQFNAIPNQANQFTPNQANQFTPNQANQFTPNQANQFTPNQANQFTNIPNQGNQFTNVPNQGNQFNQGFGQQQFGMYQTPYNNMTNGTQFNQFQGMGNFQQPFNPPPVHVQNPAQYQGNQFVQQQPLSQQFNGMNLGQSFPSTFNQPNPQSNTMWQ